jgi:hypothetical protein
MACQCSGRQLHPVMDFYLHNHPIIPPVVSLDGSEHDDVHSCTLGHVLEEVATDRDVLFPKEHSMWKILNRRTDGCTPTYILQKWTKITTSVMECGER